jgi:hypothetical protein
MSAPFACDITAIPAAERPAHHELICRLMYQVVEETRELPDGLEFRFAAGEYDAVVRFVARERLCCPFLRFTLDVAPERGPLWLRLTGAEGVKDFIRAELGLSADACSVEQLNP